MLKLSACVEMLFASKPFIERPALAKAAGFSAYEFWGWDQKDIPAIEDAQKKAGIPCAGCCVSTRDKSKAAAYGDGCLLNAKNAAVYAEMIEETVESTGPLNVTTFIATTGQALPSVSREKQRDAIIECLRAAAPVAEKAGVTLVLEPLNILVDHKGYFLSESAEAAEILRAVNSPSVKMLFDIYHQQITEGNLTDNIRAYANLIGHFHLADVPGRHQPGTGEINYAHVMKVIGETAYGRYVGCEYTPSGASDEASAELILSCASRAR